MSCVVRTNRREDLAVRGTLNSFRLLQPLFALQGILDHLPNRPRRHTCLKSRPSRETPSEYPWTEPKTARTILNRERTGRETLSNQETDDPNAPAPKPGRKGPAWTTESAHFHPTCCRPNAKSSESGGLPKAAQVPPKTPNGFKRARSLFRRARGRTPTMYLYISHSVFVSFLGGHSEHLLLISVVANPNKLNTLLLICSRKNC
jgi:hypothetical protein